MGLFNKGVFYQLSRLTLYLSERKERKLALRHRLEKEEFTRNGPNKVFESFIAPPSFSLYLWAAFPMLMIATYETWPIIAGIIATVVNFFIVHMDTYAFFRYVLATLVTFSLFVLYHNGIFIHS